MIRRRKGDERKTDMASEVFYSFCVEIVKHGVDGEITARSVFVRRADALKQREEKRREIRKLRKTKNEMLVQLPLVGFVNSLHKLLLASCSHRSRHLEGMKTETRR
jgi:hypothetical protein